VRGSTHPCASRQVDVHSLLITAMEQLRIVKQ
jgi:hypothetical protein